MEAEESFALPKIEEIEEAISREKPRRNAKGAAPVLESQKPAGRRKDADQAYDTAYDAEADFEVIDTPPVQPVLTAADYAAKGLPMPPSEDDVDEAEVSQASRKTRRGRSGKTVTEALDEAAKGKKKAEPRKPKTEKRPAEALPPQDEAPVVAETLQPAVDSQPSLPEADSVPADLEEVAQAIQQEVAGESADILLAQQPETVKEEALPEPTADEASLTAPTEASREAETEQSVPMAAEPIAEAELTDAKKPADAEEPTEPVVAEEPAEPAIAEEPAEPAEAPAAPESDEPIAADETDMPATTTPPQSFDDSAPKPKLRHLSIDDFVFGIDPDEHKELSLDEVPEPEMRKPRKPNRRRRRPASPAAETEATETETIPASEKPARKRKSSSKRNTKTVQAETLPSEQQAAEPQAEGKTRKPRRRRKAPATPPAEA